MSRIINDVIKVSDLSVINHENESIISNLGYILGG